MLILRKLYLFHELQLPEVPVSLIDLKLFLTIALGCLAISVSIHIVPLKGDISLPSLIYSVQDWELHFLLNQHS